MIRTQVSMSRRLRLFRRDEHVGENGDIGFTVDDGSEVLSRKCCLKCTLPIHINLVDYLLQSNEWSIINNSDLPYCVDSPIDGEFFVSVPSSKLFWEIHTNNLLPYSEIAHVIPL